MTKAPDLIPVYKLAKERGVSSEVMRRRLQRLEHSSRRKVLYKGPGRNEPWLADRAFLSKLAGDGGKSVWERLRNNERELADLRVEVGELRRILVENGFV